MLLLDLSTADAVAGDIAMQCPGTDNAPEDDEQQRGGQADDDREVRRMVDVF